LSKYDDFFAKPYQEKMKVKNFLSQIKFIKRYLGKPRWDTGISPPELLTYLDTHVPGNALDIGCGTGTNMVTLGKRGWLPAGIDFVPQAVWRARRKLAKNHIHGKVIFGDVTSYHLFPYQFALVLDVGCFHGLQAEMKIRYIENLPRYLKPGGEFLLYAHRKVNPAGDHGIEASDLSRLSTTLTECKLIETFETWKDMPGFRLPALWALYRKEA
jgi:SAM-dependent methyltransferase